MAGRILVLDDEENYAEMLQGLLREHNYLVDIATRPEHAIAQLEKINYDLVISDYKMPVMDGADFLKRARQLYPDLPFILVSGLMNTPELVKVANMSVTLVMEKPLDTAAFLNHVARFCDAMSVEEQAGLAEGSERSESDAAEANLYPQAPRFFSAASPASEQFLQTAWELCREHSHLFILEPEGGDADLLLQDLALWHGNSDQAPQCITLEDCVAGGTAALQDRLARSESPAVLGVRLSSLEQIADAQQHWQQLAEHTDAAASLLWVYVLTGEFSQSAFLQSAGSAACVVPRLRERPSDIAAYVRRFSALAAGARGLTEPMTLSAEAVYAIMAHAWPRNYEQLKQVIAAAAEQSPADELSLDALQSALGALQMPPPPEDRMQTLMTHAQRYQLEVALDASAGSVTQLARQLQLSGSIQTPQDLQSMRLIDPKLASL